jgi:hypothetical protein
MVDELIIMEPTLKIQFVNKHIKKISVEYFLLSALKQPEGRTPERLF